MSRDRAEGVVLRHKLRYSRWRARRTRVRYNAGYAIVLSADQLSRSITGFDTGIAPACPPPHPAEPLTRPTFPPISTTSTAPSPIPAHQPLPRLSTETHHRRRFRPIKNDHHRRILTLLSPRPPASQLNLPIENWEAEQSVRAGAWRDTTKAGKTPTPAGQRLVDPSISHHL